ncbi:MAG: site-specific integrase [Acidobacteria bacterium]|nr:site-specific integrase [Acidobacteriota bacterium]
MSVFKNGRFYHYEFQLDGRRHRGSTGTASKPHAIAEERRQRERLETSYSQVVEQEAREQQRKTIQQAADEFLLDYKLKHESATFAVYALGHVTDHLGGKLVVEITPTVVKRYQTDRLAEKAGPKTVNDEVLVLLRLCGDQGDLIRAKLRREKAMKLPTPPSPGRAYTADEKARMLAEAAKLRSRNMYPALVVDLNCGLRDKELRELRWQQIDLVHKKQLTVGKSKTDAGTGRVIPLNDTAIAALEAHASWYTRRFGECRPEWFVFAFGKPLPKDPTRPITSFKTAWTKVREKAGVKGRWHDNRHTLVTELAESGAGDEVIMSIAGHVSRAMLSRYSHVRMEAKRRALDEIAARQRGADEKRKAEAERQQAAAVTSQSAVIQ